MLDFIVNFDRKYVTIWGCPLSDRHCWLWPWTDPSVIETLHYTRLVSTGSYFCPYPEPGPQCRWLPGSLLRQHTPWYLLNGPNSPVLSRKSLWIKRKLQSTWQKMEYKPLYSWHYYTWIQRLPQTDYYIRCKPISKTCIFWIDDLWKIVNKINSVGISLKYLINVDVFFIERFSLWR